MRGKYVVLGLAGLMLLAGGAWWFGSPWWTLKAMREAAAAHDEPALSAYVDYPALRESMKAQVTKQVGGSELGDVGTAIAGIIVGPLIDAAVTPQGVQAMFRADDMRLKAGETPETAGGHLPKVPQAKDNPLVERKGLGEFTLRGREAGSATLVFHRDGLGWRLAGVELPPPPSS